jgi:hypothetical protein
VSEAVDERTGALNRAWNEGNSQKLLGPFPDAMGRIHGFSQEVSND